MWRVYYIFTNPKPKKKWVGPSQHTILSYHFILPACTKSTLCAKSGMHLYNYIASFPGLHTSNKSWVWRPGNEATVYIQTTFCSSKPNACMWSFCTYMRIIYDTLAYMQTIKDWHLGLFVLFLVGIDVTILIITAAIPSARLRATLIPNQENIEDEVIIWI